MAGCNSLLLMVVVDTTFLCNMTRIDSREHHSPCIISSFTTHNYKHSDGERKLGMHTPEKSHKMIAALTFHFSSQETYRVRILR